MNVSIPDCFMIALIAGLLFGFVYEAFRIVRLILRFRAAVFVCDVAFFIAAAMFVCKLSEFLGSYVRLYTVLGFGAGVFTYIVTLGRLFNVLESAASVAWRRTIGRAVRNLIALVKGTCGKISQKARTVFVQIHEYLDKCEKKSADPLQSDPEKVYNNVGDRIIGEGEKSHVIKAAVRKSS